MKDKLVKYNHKKSYYRFRRVLLTLLIALPLSAAVAVPVGLSVYKDIHVHSLKQDNKQSQTKTIKQIDKLVSFKLLESKR